jgi:hypothetical protein
MKGVETAPFQKFRHAEVHKADPGIWSHRFRPHQIPVNRQRDSIDYHHAFLVKIRINNP